MFQMMRPGEMEANMLRGKLYRDHFNSWLDGSGLGSTLVEQPGRGCRGGAREQQRAQGAQV